MFLGVDLGTSSVKTVIHDEAGVRVAQSSAALTVSRPRHLWSEQNPQDWVTAAEAAILDLPSKFRGAVKAMGLSGQMHGATLLSSDDRPLRPSILWNDGRSFQQCQDLEEGHSHLARAAGSKPMPGLTAPKLAWVREHERGIFEQTAMVLLPKDYLRLVWSGDYATDMSDASGTFWLDVARRAWNGRALDATGLTETHMPQLFEGVEATGCLSAAAAARLGLPQVPIAAGAGDQAAGAIGAGVISPGDASLSLGTSGVLFIATSGFQPNTDDACHAFCHALPDRWHQMAVMLSAASAVDAAGRMAGFKTPESSYSAAQAHGTSDRVLFLPYLSGERTPHNDPHARGVWFGLGAETSPAALVHAALEGVAFGIRDGRDALLKAGGTCTSVSVTGGGARSAYWGRLLASILDMPLIYRRGAEVGPADGAARLARLALTGEPPQAICTPAPVEKMIEPEADLVDAFNGTYQRWRALYQQTKNLMAESTAS